MPDRESARGRSGGRGDPAVAGGLPATEIIAGTWKAAQAHNVSIPEADATRALQWLDPLWEGLFPAEQARIVTLIVERVDIGADGLNVRLRVDGLGGLAREMMAGGIEAAT